MMSRPVRCDRSDCNGIHSNRHSKYINWSSFCEGVKQKKRDSQNNPRHREKTRQDRVRYRQLCLDHYGRQCACCGETEEKFLVFDHIDNDGAKHRRDLRNNGGWVMCVWLVRHGFPESPRIQVLCANCNTAKVYGGPCPHKIAYDV